MLLDYANLSPHEVSTTSQTLQIPLSELEVYRQPFGWIYHVIGGFLSFTQSTLGLGPIKDSNSFLARIENQLEDPLYSIYFEPYAFSVYLACPLPRIVERE